MKPILILLVVLFSFENGFGGCGTPLLTIINKDFPSSRIVYKEITVSGSQQFTLQISISLSCDVFKDVVLFFENQAQIPTTRGDYLCTYVLPEKPGHYRIEGRSESYFWYAFDLVPRPHIEDSLIAVLNTTLTGLPVITTLNPEFLSYPNPAKDYITLQSETDQIEKVSFYTSLGALLNTFEVHQIKTSIPLDEFPRDVYFMQVTTLSEKIILKKIIVR